MRMFYLTFVFVGIVLIIGKEPSMGWGEYGVRLGVFALAYAVLAAIFVRKVLDRQAG
jgi:hypothetical protein